jgi:hypothetical protein
VVEECDEVDGSVVVVVVVVVVKGLIDVAVVSTELEVSLVVEEDLWVLVVEVWSELVVEVCSELVVEVCSELVVEVCSELVVEVWSELVVEVCSELVVEVCSELVVEVCSELVVEVCSELVVEVCSELVVEVCSELVVDICSELVGEVCSEPVEVLWVDVVENWELDCVVVESMDVGAVWLLVEDCSMEELIVVVTVVVATWVDEKILVGDMGDETVDFEPDEEVVGVIVREVVELEREVDGVDTVLVDDVLLVLVARVLDVELEITEETPEVSLEDVVLVCRVGSVVALVEWVLVDVLGVSVERLLLLDKLELFDEVATVEWDVGVLESVLVVEGGLEERDDVEMVDRELEEATDEVEVGWLTDERVLDRDEIDDVVGSELVVALVVELVLLVTEELDSELVLEDDLPVEDVDVNDEVEYTVVIIVVVTGDIEAGEDEASDDDLEVDVVVGGTIVWEFVDNVLELGTDELVAGWEELETDELVAGWEELETDELVELERELEDRVLLAVGVLDVSVLEVNWVDRVLGTVVLELVPGEVTDFELELELEALEVGKVTVVCLVEVAVVGFVLDVAVLDVFVLEVIGGGTTELELVVGFMLDVSVIVIVVVVIGFVVEVEVFEMELVDSLIELDWLELALDVVLLLEVKVKLLERSVDVAIDELELFTLEVEWELIAVALDESELELSDTMLVELETEPDFDVADCDIVDEVFSQGPSLESGLYQ